MHARGCCGCGSSSSRHVNVITGCGPLRARWQTSEATGTIPLRDNAIGQSAHTPEFGRLTARCPPRRSRARAGRWSGTELPLGLRDREVAAPSLSYREPPSTRSVVVYIGGVATLEKAPLSAKSRLPRGGIGIFCPWRVCASCMVRSWVGASACGSTLIAFSAPLPPFPARFRCNSSGTVSSRP